MTPTQTGAAAITATGISTVLAWLIPLIAHVTLPGDVAMAIASLLLYLGHLVAVRVAPKAGP